MTGSAERRVVITGLGLVSPLGSTKEELWDALAGGRSGVDVLASVPSGALPVTFGAEARGFTGAIENFGPLDKERGKAIRKGLKVMCRETQMGVAAAQLAQHDAGVKEGDVDPERSGIVFGSDYMLTVPQEFSDGMRKCADTGAFDAERWGVEGLEQMNPLWLLKYLPNMPASHIAIFNDLRGPNNSLTLREAAGNSAIGEAYQTILRNSADRMVAGATGTRVHPMKAVHAAQNEQLATSNGDPAAASRPFDRDRTGQVLGEGAGAIVLEELETARARGATIYAEIVGAATSAVADRRGVANCAAALENAMRSVLEAAGATPADVGHIHAHGLATLRLDADEARAIGAVFGAHATKVPVVAAKSSFGNLGAGSGVVELIASVMALRAERLFAVLNYQTPDPECPVAAVTSAGVRSGRSFLNLSTTPQGQAAVVMVRAYG